MADKLATPLGIESILVSEEVLVAQDDIRSLGKTVETLIAEFDQQAYEDYLSSGSEATPRGRKCSTKEDRRAPSSPSHPAVIGSPEPSPMATEAPCRDFPQVVGGPSPPARRNHNAERRQRRQEICLQLEAAAMPSSPLDLSRVSIAKCVGSVQDKM